MEKGFKYIESILNHTLNFSQVTHNLIADCFDEINVF